MARNKTLAIDSIHAATRSLREWSQGQMGHNPENAEACKDIESAAVLIEQLRDVIRHCWIHSGCKNCGRIHMGEQQGKLYDEIVLTAIWDGS